MDEGLRSELSKQGVFTTTLEELYNWGRKNSIWPLQFGLACCAIEMIATTMARYDLARFGAEVFRPSPRRLTRDHLVALREVGFNRASMGVQDFNQQVQEAIHRIQPREMTQQAMDGMRELGYGSINLDLIYGLPHQTPATFNETLDTVLEMKPDRLAVFSYAQHFVPELAALAPFESDGLVKRTPNGFEVTDAGRLFIRNIAMCFDNTLAPAGERRHSKTI